LIIAGALALSARAEVTIRLVASDPPHIEVAGAPADSLAAFADARPDPSAWQKLLAVYVVTGRDRSAQPVFGEYAVEDGRLIFKPAFPLKPGLSYRAVFNAAALRGDADSSEQPLETIVSLPAPPRGEPAVIEAVFPSSDILPANQLKFYIHFSAPMSRGDSYRHIRLLDEAGRPVEAPFLELAEELWDESGSRLTLLLDPGRVKQDLKPHKEVGRALAEGRNYTLLIDADWRDAQRAPLASEFRKTFRVTEDDVRQPDPRRWRLTPPRAGTREPLIVDFDEPLDHAMLQYAIRVAGTENRVQVGRTHVDKHETRWIFRPDSPWLAGAYQLHIDPTLEDLAGNSVERPFEVHLPSARPAKIDRRIIRFEVP
jgi:hypothetical protein